MLRSRITLAVASTGLLLTLVIVSARAVSSAAHELVPGGPKGTHETPHRGQFPLGSWKRVVGPESCTLTFEADGLRGTFVRVDDGKPITTTFWADCALSKDGILFGLITSATVEAGQALAGDEDRLKTERAFIDSPLSLRFRRDGSTLTVKDFRIGVVGAKMNEADIAFVTGRYSRQDATGTPRLP